MFAEVCIGYGLWETLFEEPVALPNPRTIGACGYEGARPFVGPHGLARRIIVSDFICDKRGVVLRVIYLQDGNVIL